MGLYRVYWSGNSGGVLVVMQGGLDQVWMGRWAACPEPSC